MNNDHNQEFMKKALGFHDKKKQWWDFFHFINLVPFIYPVRYSRRSLLTFTKKRSGLLLLLVAITSVFSEYFPFIFEDKRPRSPNKCVCVTVDLESLVMIWKISPRKSHHIWTKMSVSDLYGSPTLRTDLGIPRMKLHRDAEPSI